jgi:hypothetical protein
VNNIKGKIMNNPLHSSRAEWISEKTSEKPDVSWTKNLHGEILDPLLYS